MKVATDRRTKEEVFAANAIYGRDYICPLCGVPVTFVPARQQTPHFRHLPYRASIYCENYSSGLAAGNEGDYLPFERGPCLKLESIGLEWKLKVYFPAFTEIDLRNIRRLEVETLYIGVEGELKRLNAEQLWPYQGGGVLTVVPKTNLYKVIDFDTDWLSLLDSQWQLNIPGLNPEHNVFIDSGVGYCRLRPNGSIRLGETIYIVTQGELFVPNGIKCNYNGDNLGWKAWSIEIPAEYNTHLQLWINRLGYKLSLPQYTLGIVNPISQYISHDRIHYIEKTKHMNLYLYIEKAKNKYISIRHIKPDGKEEIFSTLVIKDIEYINVNNLSPGRHLIYLHRMIGKPLAFQITEGSFRKSGEVIIPRVTFLDSKNNFINSLIYPEKEVLETPVKISKLSISGPENLKVIIQKEESNFTIEEYSVPFEYDIQNIKQKINLTLPGFWSFSLVKEEGIPNKEGINESRLALVKELVLILLAHGYASNYPISLEKFNRLLNMLKQANIGENKISRIRHLIIFSGRKVPFIAHDIISRILYYR